MYGGLILSPLSSDNNNNNNNNKTRKEEKYAELDSRYLSEPIAVETLGVFNTSANSLLKEIGL